KNTDLIIVGDHLFMSSPEQNAQIFGQDREGASIFNLFYINDRLADKRDMMTHFDLFPTLYQLTGGVLNGDRMGLGWSLINSDTDISGYSYYLAEMKQNLMNKSDKYVEFWQ